MALQNDLTVGQVRGHLLRFALPLIVSNLFQALYNAVDMFFVGRYAGTAGLSAVSVSGPIMNIMIMTVSGLSVGVSVVVAHYVGDGRQDAVKRCGNTAILFYLLCALGVTVLGWIFTPAILRLVNTPQEAMEMAVSYLRTIFVGMVFLFGYNLICALQRGFGDSKFSMLFVMVAGVVNLLLDWLLIAGWQMGAFGAALATVIAQGVSLLLGILWFRRNRHILTFSPRDFCLDRPYLKELLYAGLPAAAQQLLLNISHTTLSGIANSFGLSASAAYGIGLKVDGFAFLPSDAINASMASFASQNLGAGKVDRAKKGLREAMKLSVAMAVAVALTVALLAPYIARIFNSDPEVVAYTVQYLRITCFAYLVFATVHPFIGFIRGTGNSMQTLINVVFAQYLVRIPLALLFSHLWGFSGVAVAVITAPLFSTFTYGHFVLSGRWKRSRDYRRMLEQHPEAENL